MSYVPVNIIAPDGRRFRASVDEDADPSAFVRDFVSELDLPSEENGQPIAYTAHLVGAFKIHKGATIEIVKVEPPRTFLGLTED